MVGTMPTEVTFSRSTSSQKPRTVKVPGSTTFCALNTVVNGAPQPWMWNSGVLSMGTAFSPNRSASTNAGVFTMLWRAMPCSVIR